MYNKRKREEIFYIMPEVHIPYTYIHRRKNKSAGKRLYNIVKGTGGNIQQKVEKI